MEVDHSRVLKESCVMIESTKEILTRLVGYPVLGGQSNLTIIEYIKSMLEEHGVPYHLVPNAEGNKTSLHCRIGPAVDGGVILSGHTDVVPVEGQDWHTNPFALTEKDGKLYGRGSADMKGFIACCLGSLPLFLKADLKKPIYFAFSYDEEVGCLGAPELIEHIKSTYTETPKYAIIGEPSMMQPIVGQKGICVFLTTVHGSAGHSSRIKQEVSAIHEAARLVLWLESKMDSFLEAGQVDDRFTPNHTSIHIGKLNGGIAHNVVADRCTFICDVRNIPLHHVDQIEQEYLAHVHSSELALKERFPEARIEVVRPRPIVPALNTPIDLSIVPLIQKIAPRSDLGAVSYAAEAGQFAEGGFESVICGPGDIAQAHRANEFIDIQQLEQCLVMMEKLVTEMS